MNKFERSEIKMAKTESKDLHKYVEIPVSADVEIDSVEKVIEIVNKFDDRILDQDVEDFDDFCTEIEMMIDEGYITFAADGIILWND